MSVTKFILDKIDRWVAHAIYLKEIDSERDEYQIRLSFLEIVECCKLNYPLFHDFGEQKDFQYNWNDEE